MNTGNLLHQNVGALSRRLQTCSDEIAILKSKLDGLASEEPAAGNNNEDVEQMIRDIVKKELGREKAILEATLNHKMDQQVTRAFGNNDNARTITALSARIDELERQRQQPGEGGGGAPPAEAD